MIYLFPTEMEAAKFRAARPEAEIRICGVGAVECAAAVAIAAAENPDRMVILAGIAGSHDPARAALGEVVEVVSEQLFGLPERFSCRYSTAPKFALRGVSSATVNTSGVSCGADVDIENMEGAALFALSSKLGFRFAELRAISNMVGDDFALWQLDRAIAALTAQLLKL